VRHGGGGYGGLRVGALRDSLLHQLESAAGGLHINGAMSHRLPGNLNVSFEGVDGDALLAGIPEIAVSAGSACSSGSDSSYVLEALGLPPALLQCAMRFGIGRSNTQAEIDYAASRVAAVVSELRALSPVL
jgi:cysteine desulfurase